MTFATPEWLVLGVLIVAAFIVGGVVASRRRAAALAAAGVAVDGARRGRQYGLWLTVAGIAMLAVAVAGPAASMPVTRAAGTVILAMDVSNSMAATDVGSTRLDAAKNVAIEFIEAQPDSVDIGVVAFQTGGLTTDLPGADHAEAAAAINRLTVIGGTSVADAILTSLSAITGKPVSLPSDGTLPDIGYWASATIVLFSDGENTGSAARMEAAATLAQNAGVHVQTVGVGTSAGTTVKVDGYTLRTALDVDILTAIAETTGGRYHPASNPAELNGIASRIDLRLTTTNQDVPLAGGFSALAVALLALGAVLTVLRTGRIV